MTQVVLDTNAFLLPVSDGTDLVAELQGLLGEVHLVVALPTIGELRTLQEGEGQTAKAARAGGRLLADCRVEATDLPGDDAVLDVARRLGAAVLTNDRAVQQEARRAGLTVVASRGKGRLWLPFGA